MVAPHHPRKTVVKPKWLFPLTAIALLFIAASLYPDFLDPDKEEPALSPERQEKLQRELDELENAEQYVLRAAQDNWYPCYHCTGKNRIFLLKDEVWKYGVTRKGEERRYGSWHTEQGLYYLVQYQGTLQDCLRQEKIKIYNYALLPENLKREQPLIRPPGNKRDD